MGSRNCPLFGDSDKNPNEECCGESSDGKISSVHEEDESGVPVLRTLSATGKARGGDCTDTNGRDGSSNSVPWMDDSMNTEWTDDKHSSYLNSIEASFVKQMYDTEYCALDLCGQAPKQRESSDPDSAESRPNFPSPFDMFTVLQRGRCRKLNFNKSQNLEESVSAPKLLPSPWVQHFIPTAYSKRQVAPSRTTYYGISIAGGEQMCAAESKHIRHMRTVQEAVQDADQLQCVWHQRLQHNSSGSNRDCGKREQGNIYGRKFHARPAAVSDKVDQDIQGEAKTVKIDANKLIKKQQFNIESVDCSAKDQVVPFLKTLNSQDAGDCLSSLIVKDFILTDHQCNDLAGFLPTGNIMRTSSLENKQPAGNDGDTMRDDCPESPRPDNRYDVEGSPVANKCSLSKTLKSGILSRRQSLEENLENKLASS